MKRRDLGDGTATRRRGFGWWFFGALWLIAGLILVGVSVVGYWGRSYWYLDALSHFRLQYLVISAVLCLLLLWRRRWLLFLLPFAVLLQNTYETFNIPSSIGLWYDPALKAISINVYTRNHEIQRTIDYLRSEKPDFVALTELTGDWKLPLESMRDMFPFQDVRIYGNNFGSAILSSHPMTDRKFPYVGAGAIIREVQIPTGNLILLQAHPLSPMNERAWSWRNSAFNDIVKYAPKADAPLLVMGDFNCSPYSPNFQDFLEASGLHLPETGILPRRTWPSGKPWYWIPIDHFLLSPQLTALTDWVGPSVGSDHYPIVLIFAETGEK